MHTAEPNQLQMEIPAQTERNHRTETKRSETPPELNFYLTKHQEIKIMSSEEKRIYSWFVMNNYKYMKINK